MLVHISVDVQQVFFRLLFPLCLAGQILVGLIGKNFLPICLGLAYGAEVNRSTALLVARTTAFAEKILAFPFVSFRGCEVNANKAQRHDDGENGEKYFLTHDYVPSFPLDFLWIYLETLTVDLILSTFQPVRPLCNGKKDASFDDREICYNYKCLRKNDVLI